MLVQAIGNPVPFLKKPRFRSSCCEEPCWTCAGMNYYSWHMESLWRHFGPLCWHKELCNVMMLQAAPSTCRCSLEEGPHVRFWVSCQNVGDVFSRFDLPSVCDFIVGWCWTLFYATASGSYRSFHSSMKFLRQVQVQMLDQRVEDPSECCKDTSINVNIVFASVPCPFSRLRSCCQLLKTKMVVDNWTSGRSLHCLACRSNTDQAGCSDSSWMLHNRYKGFKSPRYPVSEHTSGKV